MDPLANVGGCPNEWEEWTNDPEQTKYEAGDMVSLNGLVYKCKSDPYSEHCGSVGYQPEEDIASKSPEVLFYSLSLSLYLLSILQANRFCFPFFKQ